MHINGRELKPGNRMELPREDMQRKKPTSSEILGI